MAKNRIDDLLRKVPVSRRKAVKALLIGTFAAPVVASYPMKGRFAMDQAFGGTPVSSPASPPPPPPSPAPSDIRLKRDIHALMRLDNGLTLYRFRYLWNDVEMVGVMAQEVLEIVPEAVAKGEDGHYRVDYGRLGLRFMTYAEWLAEKPLAAAA